VVKPFLGKTVFSPFLGKKKAQIVHKKRQCLILSDFTWLPSTTFSRFLIISNFFGIGHHLGWRHRPPAELQPIIYTSSCEARQRLSTKGKTSPKYWNTAKTQGRGSIPPPSPPPCTIVELWLLVRQRVNIGAKIRSKLHWFDNSWFANLTRLGLLKDYFAAFVYIKELNKSSKWSVDSLGDLSHSHYMLLFSQSQSTNPSPSAVNAIFPVLK